MFRPIHARLPQSECALEVACDDQDSFDRRAARVREVVRRAPTTRGRRVEVLEIESEQIVVGAFWSRRGELKVSSADYLGLEPRA